MIDDTNRRVLEPALERLAERIRSPRAIAIAPPIRQRLETAIDRVRACWLGPTEPVLTVALAGGTGVGKSTLINALAGHTIAEASEIRPTTRHIQVYHHREDSLGNLTEELSGEAAFVAHDRPELRLKMIVDSPDLDSFVIRHRATTKALLRRAGLVLYVFSPERYLEERTWSVLRQETDYSACAAILNKVDRFGSLDELDQITEDLREHFAELGRGEIKIFRICARNHVAEANGNSVAAAAPVDDMAALRAFVERELESSEIARLLRVRRASVLAHLGNELDRVAPATMPARLDEIGETVRGRASAAAARLAELFTDRFAIVEAELAPLAAMRLHEQFRGPFRVWLAIGDLISLGVSSLLRRSLDQNQGERASVIAGLLERGGAATADQLLQVEADAIQDILFRHNLPLERWRERTSSVNGPALIDAIAADIKGVIDVNASKFSKRERKVVKVVSALGAIVPSALVVVGLVVMTRDVFAGNYVGLPLLWHLFAMVVLFFMALQGAVSTLLPGSRSWIGPSIGPQAVHRVVTRTIEGWFADYRSKVDADVSDLRTPLAAFQAAIDIKEETAAG